MENIVEAQTKPLRLHVRGYKRLFMRVLTGENDNSDRICMDFFIEQHKRVVRRENAKMFNILSQPFPAVGKMISTQS